MRIGQLLYLGADHTPIKKIYSRTHFEIHKIRTDRKKNFVFCDNALISESSILIPITSIVVNDPLAGVTQSRLSHTTIRHNSKQ